ncbi:MAG: hypothetical protein EZS28_038818 [Streblomastix strix]|uniref:Uncharacterized protein n=1 Tax=Streblomastix strix TaxID=222440 RepID=A0A5J4U7E4_9EUKA|nr:MAG: hypothetical protein EZS28_038818 [Streblomastix strix]
MLTSSPENQHTRTFRDPCNFPFFSFLLEESLLAAPLSSSNYSRPLETCRFLQSAVHYNLPISDLPLSRRSAFQYGKGATTRAGL